MKVDGLFWQIFFYFQYILEKLISSSYTDKLLWCLTYLKRYPFLLEYFTRLQHLSPISLFIYNISLHTIIFLPFLENVFTESTSISSFDKSDRWSKLWTGSIKFFVLTADFHFGLCPSPFLIRFPGEKSPGDAVACDSMNFLFVENV